MNYVRIAAAGCAALVLAACTSGNSHQAGPDPTSVTATPSVTSVAAPSSSATAPASTASSNGPQSALPTPSSSISATSTAQAWTQSEALTRATAITRDANSAVATLAGVSAKASLAQARAALRAIAAADDSVIHRLAVGAWPVAARTPVDKFIAALDAERRMMLVLEQRTSVAAMQRDGTQVGALLAEANATGRALLAALRG